MGDSVLMQQWAFSVVDWNATITELAGVLLQQENGNDHWRISDRSSFVILGVFLLGVWFFFSVPESCLNDF